MSMLNRAISLIVTLLVPSIKIRDFVNVALQTTTMRNKKKNPIYSRIPIAKKYKTA